MNDDTSVQELELSVRAANVLYNANLVTVKQAREALVDGRLMKYRNCGRLTVNELARALGMPEQYSVKPFTCTRRMECPNCGYVFVATMILRLTKSLTGKMPK